MKRIITALALLVSSFYTTVQADNGDKGARLIKVSEVSRSAKAAFNKQFPHAQYQSWQLLNGMDLYLVRFVNNQEGLIAYVDGTGEVIAIVRSIDKTNMPLTVSSTVSNEYGKYEVGEVLEMVLFNELNYVVTLENDKTKLTVKISSDGNVSQVKKEKLKPSVK